MEGVKNRDVLEDMSLKMFWIFFYFSFLKIDFLSGPPPPPLSMFLNVLILFTPFLKISKISKIHVEIIHTYTVWNKWHINLWKKELIQVLSGLAICENNSHVANMRRACKNIGFANKVNLQESDRCQLSHITHRKEIRWRKKFHIGGAALYMY